MIDALPDVPRGNVVHDGEAGATTRTSDDFLQFMLVINVRSTYNDILESGLPYH
jgi:hypothetical protein